MPVIEVIHGDCLEWLRGQPDDSVDMVFGSPPYEAARTYGIDFKLRGQDWVDWMVERWTEMDRVCRGLVAMVVEGQTRSFCWSAAPALLMADLHRAGILLRKPPAFCRVGIPGSGGPDWVRNDYEFVVCSTKGKLPWSDNTAMGHSPKYEPGGPMSNRKVNGGRVNRDAFGFTPHVEPSESERRNGNRRIQHAADGTVKGRHDLYAPPVKANPGNLIRCKVGGGVMGNRLCHENEAPFPESLAEFFVRSFCPPGGVVLDPFCGSGTTLAVAVQWERRAIGIDVRESQVALTNKRVREQVGLWL